MQTIQMTIDEPLLKTVDKLVQSRKTTRSAFIREAIVAEIKREHTRGLEKKHIRGYETNPVKPGEFDLWEKEQAWDR